MDDVAAAARRWGIEPGYRDVFGRWHAAGADTVARLVAAISRGRPSPLPAAGARPGRLRAFQGDGRRLWALGVQLYALRSRRNWGHGDFGDLARLIAIAAAHGAGAIALNPLHARFAGRASPYAPNSRLFLDPLYIDVDAVPEFPGRGPAGLDTLVPLLRCPDTIDYAGVARAKVSALRLAHARFRDSGSAGRRADFDAYRQERGDALRRFAAFECLRGLNAGRPWPDWPAPWRRPGTECLDALQTSHAAEVEFHEYVQWNAERQLAACQDAARRAGMPIGLYVDLAVGIDPNGADAWSAQDALLHGLSIGAPPDELNTAGQDWGLAPFDPFMIAADDFAATRALVAAAMRHAGAVRLDHVLGLERLFLVPRGADAAEGAYVRYPFAGLLRVIAEESRRFRAVVIGEDLGTVPEGFRVEVAQWGLWSCRVMLFERDADGRFRVPSEYPAEALASFNTHDLASLRGWFAGHDLEVKRAIGIDPGETVAERAAARATLRTALSAAGGGGRDDLAGVASFLAQTLSRLAAIALDDIVGEIEQINVPGTVAEHPNWQRRLSLPLEALDGHAGLARVASIFAEAGRSAR